jgi:hypothetical protein
MGGAPQVAIRVASQIWQIVFALQTLKVFRLALRKKPQYVVVIGWVHPKSTHLHPLAWGNNITRFAHKIICSSTNLKFVKISTPTKNKNMCIMTSVVMPK